MEEKKEFEKLYQRCEEVYAPEELELIRKAYDFGKKHHEGKKRLNGADYMTHPIGVCDILLDINVDATTIAAGLIHETLNHGTATKEEILETFGENICQIVEVISKLNRLELSDDSSYSVMNFRKVLVGMSEDVRVLFIKMADRLHNLRTADALDPEALKKKVHETMTVLIPIAHRLGMYQIKGEMEDYCLKYSKPDVYQDILDRLNATEKELHDSLEEMADSISEMLMEQNIPFHMKSRVKSVYSIYNKLNNGKKWENIYDILALRIIVEKVSDCYLTIGLIHAKYRPIPGRFKDYIAMPKQNMYQSLHTGVFGSDGNKYEVQVRTEEMDEIAEKGVASHFSYKEKETQKHMKNVMEQKLEIFRNLIESTDSLSDKDFQNSLEEEFLNESIYVFTPKGDVLELPKGSTPVDYAYRIHSEVGNKMVGAIVNDAIVPLSYELQNNDVVKIKTNANSTPNKEWLNFTKTAHARNKIKAYFSKQEKENYTEAGKNILMNELRKRKLVFDTLFTQENIKKVCSELKLEDLDDIYFSIGSLRFTTTYILSVLMGEKKEIQDVLLERVQRKEYKNDSSINHGILVNGETNILVTLAKCCHPIYGDEIIGFITKGEGVSVHKKDCPNVLGRQSRLVDVSWNVVEGSTFLSHLQIRTDKTKNYLADLISKSSEKNVYIESVQSTEKNDEMIFDFMVKTANKSELENFMDSIQAYSFVRSVTRL